jgi:Domain of unknown function (DUF2760)
MGRIALAFKLFFKTLGNAAFAERARTLFEPAEPALGPQIAAPARVSTAAPPVRSDAITLLAVLQRESRLIDFLKEDIGAYADAQIGAAVRDVHRDAGAALERMVALRPVVDQVEGSEVALASPVDANRYRLVGNLGSQAPALGRLQHQGWQATKLDLPQYTGTAQTARIVAPAEVEV